jgi:hypothetical protein
VFLLFLEITDFSSCKRRKSPVPLGSIVCPKQKFSSLQYSSEAFCVVSLPVTVMPF